jgi:hypothetical protein
VGKGVYPLLAMNGTSDIGTFEMSEAARTRMIHLYVGTQAPTYWDSWSRWAVAADLEPSVSSFCRHRADLFAACETFEELARFNPRTGGTMLGKLVTALDTVQFQTDDIMLPLLAGCVTRAIAVQFLAHRAIFKQLPDLDEVLRKPQTTSVPDSNGVLYAFGAALARKVKAEPKKAGAALTYISRWPNEMAAYGLNVLQVACPAVNGTDEYARLMNKIGG